MEEEDSEEFDECLFKEKVFAMVQVLGTISHAIKYLAIIVKVVLIIFIKNIVIFVCIEHMLRTFNKE